MEQRHRDTTILETFYFSSRHSPFLRQLMPLLESNDGLPEPEREVKSLEGIQVLWRQEHDREHYFAQLCLTLSRQTLALTVATSYKEHPLSTLVIEQGNHALFESDKLAMPTGYYRGDEAISRFNPNLNGLLSVLQGKDTPHTAQEEPLAS